MLFCIVSHVAGMPRRKKRVADMGAVDRLGAKYRAHVQYCNDGGVGQNLYGPYRLEHGRAEEDLSEIRAAGVAAEAAPEAVALTDAARRQVAMDAMAATAEQMNIQRKRVADMGTVERFGGMYRAKVFDSVERRQLRGPKRLEQGRAEEDLSEMRAAGAAAEVPLEEAAAAAETRRQVALDAMAAVARRLQRTVAEERAAEARAEEAGGAAAAVAAPSKRNGSSAVSSDVAMVAAVAVPYRPCSVDADEPWQAERPNLRREREEEAWRNVTGATHDKPTFGLDRKSRQRLAKDKTFSRPVLSLQAAPGYDRATFIARKLDIEADGKALTMRKLGDLTSEHENTRRDHQCKVHYWSAGQFRPTAALSVV